MGCYRRWGGVYIIMDIIVFNIEYMKVIE